MALPLLDPSIIGATYTPPWEPEENPIYPVKNQRYKELNQHPHWETISKALNNGSISLEKLLIEKPENLSHQAIERYHQSIAQYPQVFLPMRLGLGVLQEGTKQLILANNLDTQRRSYNDQSVCFSINMGGMPFDKQVYSTNPLKITELPEGKLSYNATMLTHGENIPKILQSQGPQTVQTAPTFIKMILDAQVSAIVSLGTTEMRQGFSQYWPQKVGTAVKLTAAIIKLDQENVLGIDVQRWQRLVMRIFTANILNIGERKIHQYHWIGFDRTEQEPHPEPSYEILHTLQKELLKIEPERTICIHCHDGMERSSVVTLAFLALKSIQRQYAALADKSTAPKKIHVNVLDLALRLETERPAVESGEVITQIKSYLKAYGIEGVIAQKKE